MPYSIFFDFKDLRLFNFLLTGGEAGLEGGGDGGGVGGGE